MARGFSLIELLVAVAICSVIATIAVFNYRNFTKAYQVERQTRELRTELMKARLAAVTTQREVVARVYRDRFEIFSSAYAESGTTPALSRPLPFPVVTKESPRPYDFTISDRGIVNDTGSICIDENDEANSIDSIVISNTRMALGKRKPGKECRSDNGYIIFK